MEVGIETLLLQVNEAINPLLDIGPGPRVPEKVEMFDDIEAKTYADGCDFPETSDYAIVAAEIVKAFGQNGKLSGTIVEVCPGPGNLCGELLKKGADHVIGIDGSQTMLDHATKKFAPEIENGQINFRRGQAQALPLPDGSVDGIVNFNSFHQFASEERALAALSEMARVLKPGGWAFVRDFKRGASKKAIDARLEHTKPEIKPLLLDSLQAAFTPDEFAKMLEQIPGIQFTVTDAENPMRLSEEVCELIRNDPVDHWLDFGFSQEVKIKKL